MSGGMLFLLFEALAVYGLVLGVHSLRRRIGLPFFYALLGGLTAIMSWVTDAGVKVQAFGLTFMIGSTVFYTALLLGVFAVYVFDGPRATRVVIVMVAAVSLLTPLVALLLHLQAGLAGEPAPPVPLPNLRVNAASVVTTIADLLFLAIAWEFLGRAKRGIGLRTRLFLTLLGVMVLDVVLFSSGAFAGHPEYLTIMKGTLLSRLLVSLLAWPLLTIYVNAQRRRPGGAIENRPVLAILRQVAEMRRELTQAQLEIERRREAERRSEELIRELNRALAEVNTLRGILPICAECKKIRDEDGAWHPVESYMSSHTRAEFSHGLCPECAKKLYPDLDPGA